MILVRHDQAIALGNIDLANLKTRLHESFASSGAKLERGFCFERFDDFAGLERLARRIR